jgi:hypothetical protein
MAVLEKETDAKGRKLKVHKLPPPPPMVSMLLVSIECLYTISITCSHSFAIDSTTRRKMSKPLLWRQRIPAIARLEVALRHHTSTATSATTV